MDSRLIVSAHVLMAFGGVAAVGAQPVITSGEIVVADLDGDGDTLDLSIDRISFNVTAGTTVAFDALVDEGFGGDDLNGDGERTRFDNQMNLYRASDASLLVTHDDGPLGDDGSLFGLDGFFSYTFAESGRFFLTIGYVAYGDADARAGFQEDRAWQGAGWHADWRVTLTASGGVLSGVAVDTLGTPATPNPVPEPAAGSALLALAALRRRAITS